MTFKTLVIVFKFWKNVHMETNFWTQSELLMLIIFAQKQYLPLL